MAREKIPAKEDRRLIHRAGETVDYPFLFLLLLCLVDRRRGGIAEVRE